jgi:DNA-directed RNA polymerase subunit beta
MPARGSWLELEIDKKGKVFVRIDRKRKLPVTVLLRAMGYASDEEILGLFDNSLYIRQTIESDTEVTKTEEGALIELFKKQRPGEPPSVDNARPCCTSSSSTPSATTSRAWAATSSTPACTSTRTSTPAPSPTTTSSRSSASWSRCPSGWECPRTSTSRSRTSPRKAQMRPREPVADHLDEYEHFGNRRLRTVGELIQEAFRIGLYRMERVVRERLTTEDADTITPQTIINIRPVVAAQKEFFGSSQLSQFMDQTNSLSGLTHRRRLSALGAGGLTRERAPIEVRDVHPTHYGRMCPIETPRARTSASSARCPPTRRSPSTASSRRPYRVVRDGKVTDEIVHLDATQEEEEVIAQANTPLGEDGTLLGNEILCRTQSGHYVTATGTEVDLMDVSPEQIWSVATAMIPFLEHDDANRALMGSNMQRQAVPLLRTDAPVIGTGMERRAAVDTGDVVLARTDGTIEFVDATKIVVTTADGRDEYPLQKFMRSNQGTLIHQKPLVRAGQVVEAGDVMADGSGHRHGRDGARART